MGTASGAQSSSSPSNPVTSPDPVAKGASAREKLKVRRFCKSLAALGATKGPSCRRPRTPRESGSEQTRCPAAAVWWVLLTLSPRSPLPVPPLSIPLTSVARRRLQPHSPATHLSSGFFLFVECEIPTLMNIHRSTPITIARYGRSRNKPRISRSCRL